MSISGSPLVEVIFEIKFKDPTILDYELLVGEIFSKLKREYPNYELLKPKELPPLLLPYIMQHRFRPAPNLYPLYQLGPGVVSFNMDGNTYNQPTTNNWGAYRSKLVSFIKVYKNILNDKFDPELFEHFSLRFLNKIEDTDMYPGIKNYFDNKLNLKIDLNFATDLQYIQNLEHSQISQVYYFDEEKKSELKYNIQTITEGSRKLLFDLAVISKQIPPVDGITGWLNESHTTLKTFYDALTRSII